jgi:type I restriction-modification system DNA methylase subunit
MAIAVDKQGLKKFVEKWTGRGKEDEDDRSYWIDLFQNVFAQSDVTDRLDFQKKVVGEDGNTKRIDVYIPETNIIIEQKSLGIALDKPQAGHKGMTPYEQAKYYDNGLPRSEKARWIVTSNFDEIWVYDMEKRKPEEDVIKIYLKDLDKEYHMLLFLFDPQVEQIRRELKVSQEAGDRIGRVYDALLALYPGEPTEEEYKSLNLFCVRLVFCYYAEDAGLFNKYQFRDYVASFNPKHLRNGLKDLFRILDTKEDERDRTEEPELLAFPYVNGGLFADRNIIVPQIDEKTQSIMTETSDFNWSEISPTIFGAVFESTLNQETRRKGGMHYTSIENIHKVIDPLFLNNLKEEYKSISESKQPNIKRQRLQDFQNKLGTLKFLDPACGSGNFLTETYLSLRRMENEVIKNIIELDKTVFDKQIALGELGSANSVIKVSLSQFYGIEINDFAVSVAKTALWIAESQMLNETSAIVYHNIDFLPLKSYVNIIEGNALQLTWNDILSPNDCSYIMGNPPFVGHRNVSPEQKEDMIRIFSGKQGRLDYVSAWYAIAADYISGTEIECAFVSTNTVVQGTHIQTLWNKLIESNVIINFAHRTFVWDSEASQKAHVHCVIIGFSKKARVNKTIYDGEEQFAVQTITPYLTDGENDVIVKSASVPLCKNVPKMIYGNIPRDGGFYTFNSKEEVDEFVKSEPSAKSLIHKFIGGREFINNIDRWFLFLEDSTPSELKAMKNVMDRISKVRDFRLSSKAKEIQKFAQTPTKLAQHTQPIGVDYIAVPIVSSSRREYVPIGYVDGDTITNNQVQIIPYASVYHFGILCSSIHNDWMRKTCGRLKSDYRYSRDLVYNTFPWPNPTTEQIVRIEQTADAILEARALYPNSSLADLYDPLTMPPELRKAHDANDKAVMKAYGFSPDIEEPEIVAELMKMYQKLTEEK